MMDHAAHALVPTLVASPKLLWIPGLPLLAFTVLITLGRRLGKLAPWFAVVALAGSFLGTVEIADNVFRGRHPVILWSWLVPSSTWSLGLTVDGLSWIMLLVVTLIGTMIAIYSIGYMHGDPRTSRFFAYFSLFCASMLTLVMANHFVLLYAGWELVGLCSYLLISFWFEKPAAAEAGRKAFLTTRVGDTGLLLGIFLLAGTTGTLHFASLGAVALHVPEGLLTLISALIFIGAMGKSAQVPLHVWLPDAMEGPTPVSALIHAATMVAAGVYLVARTFPLFTPESLRVVLAVGLITHLFAGTVALTQTDIKRVLAYSTLSQLGLMMTALGLGAVTAAMFHLFTHAFFKALLFLGAGSVIHATHEQELSGLGGLRRQMPVTAALFLIASLSMGGLAGTSGFWSKDAILLAARSEAPWVMGLLLVGAVMTAAYSLRLYLRCFEGAPVRVSAHHERGAKPAARHAPHESPVIMTGPMLVLGLGAGAIGFIGSPWNHDFFSWLGEHGTHGLDVPILALSTLVLGLGAWLAWIVGVQRRNLLPSAWRPLGHRLYTWAVNKYYVDEAYHRWIITPLLSLMQAMARVDQVAIDGMVNGVGRFGRVIGDVKAWIDRTLVDGVVNGVALTVRGCGSALRWIQTGIIQQYLLIVVVSVVVLAITIHQ